MCPTQSSLNIVRRALHLNTPTNHPATIYLDLATGKRLQITAAQVAAFLRHVAHKVLSIPAGYKDLLAWSCHSIHVTAANLLHCARFLDSYIKNCLHWHSNTFLMYLRNTFHTVEQHTNAITLGLDPPPHQTPHDRSNNMNADRARAKTNYPETTPRLRITHNTTHHCS